MSIILDNLNDNKCTDCMLHRTRTNIVIGRGNPDAEILILGEAPGEEEDLRGDPFLGRSGTMVDKVIAESDKVSIDDIYITNVIKCRPPDNRDPTKEELTACMKYCTEQITVMAPRRIITLGRVPFYSLFPKLQKIPLKARVGHTYRSLLSGFTASTVIPLYHPAYMMRKRALIPAWEQLFKIALRLDIP